VRPSVLCRCLAARDECATPSPNPQSPNAALKDTA